MGGESDFYLDRHHVNRAGWNGDQREGQTRKNFDFRSIHKNELTSNYDIYKDFMGLLEILALMMFF